MIDQLQEIIRNSIVNMFRGVQTVR